MVVLGTLTGSCCNHEGHEGSENRKLRAAMTRKAPVTLEAQWCMSAMSQDRTKKCHDGCVLEHNSIVKYCGIMISDRF